MTLARLDVKSVFPSALRAIPWFVYIPSFFSGCVQEETARSSGLPIR